MLGLDNPIHLAFILVLLLLVFGAKRLPEMGRSLGTGLRGFKESINGEQPLAPMSAEPAPAHVSELIPASALTPVGASEPVAHGIPAGPVA
jgi:sec-independent protein translocase protein TatA